MDINNFNLKSWVLLETVQVSLHLAQPTAAIFEPLWLTHSHFLPKCAVQKCRRHIKLGMTVDWYRG
jgi:hypothetical protein